jgi:hypothetical protein
MLTEVEFKINLITNNSLTSSDRKRIIRNNSMQQAKKNLVKMGAEAGQIWDFEGETETIDRNNGRLIENYKFKFSIIIE